jgi:maltose alpha-D-glucosyltransferase/alpha-amylase
VDAASAARRVHHRAPARPPVIDDPVYGYHAVSVEAQRRDPHSLLNWMERKIRMRRECPEISWGQWQILPFDDVPGVLVMRYDHDGQRLVTLHNFTRKPKVVRTDVKHAGAPVLVDLLDGHDSRADARGRHTIELPAYGYRWLRAGGIDQTAPRG